MRLQMDLFRTQRGNLYPRSLEQVTESLNVIAVSALDRSARIAVVIRAIIAMRRKVPVRKRASETQPRADGGEIGGEALEPPHEIDERFPGRIQHEGVLWRQMNVLEILVTNAGGTTGLLTRRSDVTGLTISRMP